MVIAAVILQFSLTHGYLPYGSSDVLLPSLVGVTWGLELLPYFGGAISEAQYTLWQECVYSVLIGFLLRLADVKRKKNLCKRCIIRRVNSLRWIYLLARCAGRYRKWHVSYSFGILRCHTRAHILALFQCICTIRMVVPVSYSTW